MSTPRVPLPRLAHAFLRTSGGKWCRTTLTLIHRWMSQRDLTLADLTLEHLELFWQEQQQKDLASSSWHVRRCRVHKYLYWLDRKGALSFSVDPARLRHMHAPLPAPARRWLAIGEHRRHEPHVRNLHDWLDRKHLPLHELTQSLLQDFVSLPIAIPITPQYRGQLLRRLEPYLLWLHEHGLVRFRVDRQVRKSFALPDHALDFVDTLRPVRKPGTCHGYQTNLRDFHGWIDDQGLALQTLDRADTQRWLKSLADRGLAPSTRCQRICHARSYLRWIDEQGILANAPDDLLRATDLPKIPSYLPRPYPVEADRELQRLFRESGTVYGHALFLMRRSGVRIGELVRLEPRCLDEDLHGQVFLKVPLGKLDNERLVPLDDETIEIARRLQRLCPPNALFLLDHTLARTTTLSRLRRTLKHTAKDLDIPGAVVSHRLRHTYATELLNAGMSLIGIMKLLGHRSLRMTMRYAAVTQQTVVRDYFAAMEKIAPRYQMQATAPDIDAPNPDRALRDVIAYLRNHARHDDQTRLIQRLHKLRHEIANLGVTPDLT